MRQDAIIVRQSEENEDYWSVGHVRNVSSQESIDYAFDPAWSPTFDVFEDAMKEAGLVYLNLLRDGNDLPDGGIRVWPKKGK